MSTADNDKWSSVFRGAGTAGKLDECVHACNCIGPQNGEPLCPCQMRTVKIIDGRYVRTQDLGPAPKKDNQP